MGDYLAVSFLFLKDYKMCYTGWTFKNMSPGSSLQVKIKKKNF